MGQYHMGKAAASTSAEASASVATPRSHEGVGGEKTTEPSESNKKVKKNNSSDDEEKETPSNNDVLLTRLLTELPEVFEKEFLPLLHPNDLAMLMRVGHDARKVVVASGLPRAGATAELPLMVVGFCQVQRVSLERNDFCLLLSRGGDGGGAVGEGAGHSVGRRCDLFRRRGRAFGRAPVFARGGMPVARGLYSERRAQRPVGVARVAQGGAVQIESS